MLTQSSTISNCANLSRISGLSVPVMRPIHGYLSAGHLTSGRHFPPRADKMDSQNYSYSQSVCRMYTITLSDTLHPSSPHPPSQPLPPPPSFHHSMHFLLRKIKSTASQNESETYSALVLGFFGLMLYLTVCFPGRSVSYVVFPMLEKVLPLEKIF